MEYTYNKIDQTINIVVKTDKGTTTRSFKALDVKNYYINKYGDEINEVETLGLKDSYFLSNGMFNFEKFADNIGPEVLKDIYKNCI
jgi:hypothetical protein